MTTRIAALLFVFLLSAVATAQTVTFGVGTSPEGVTRTVTESMDMLMIISAGGDQMDMSQNAQKKFVEEALAVEDLEITKRKVTFSKAMKTNKSPMRAEKTTEPPVVGIPFILTRGDVASGTAPKVEREDGEDVSAEASEYLIEEFLTKQESGFGKILAGRTMTIGDQLTLGDEEMKSFITAVADESTTLKEATITLLRIEDVSGQDAAVFELIAVLDGKTPVLDMSIAMKGTASIMVEALWPLSVNIEGDITGEGNHGGTAITSDGLVSFSRSAVYE